MYSAGGDLALDAAGALAEPEAEPSAAPGPAAAETGTSPGLLRRPVEPALTGDEVRLLLAFCSLFCSLFARFSLALFAHFLAAESAKQWRWSSSLWEQPEVRFLAHVLLLSAHFCSLSPQLSCIYGLIFEKYWRNRGI